VKIAPHYHASIVHVLDASRAVGVVNSLLNEESKQKFDTQTRADYARLREEHSAKTRQKKLLTLAEARANRTAIDWSEYLPPKPEFLTTRVVCPSSVDLREYIDWSPFFHAWELRGRYPAIFEDPTIGKHARELFDYAQELLDRIAAKNLLEARGLYALWPANSVGDDVDLYTNESRTEKLATFHFLRQQIAKPAGQFNHCLADFIAPASTPQSARSSPAAAGNPPSPHPLEHRLIFKNVGRTAWSTDIDCYVRDGGYEDLRKAVKMTREEIVNEVKTSGLRGRGGAGFPCGVKWSFIKADEKKPVYLICNADESEPGTFKDRYIIHQDPHQLLEGIAISCFAINARTAYIYIRGEFPEGATILESAIAEARADNFLGKNILNTGFDLEVYIHRGAGAYICGEETGLI